MSKAFAFRRRAARVLAADPAVVDAVQLVRLPYHLSALTQAAARAALAHAPSLLGTVEAVKAQRDRIVASLGKLGLVAARATPTSSSSDSSRTPRRCGGRCSTAAPCATPGARLAAGDRRHCGRDERVPAALAEIRGPARALRTEALE
jgi:hypothetical protein